MRAWLPVLLTALPLAACAHPRPRPPAPAAAGSAANSGAPSAVVDKVVAFVANRPITLSECALEVRLERARNGDVAGALGTVTDVDEAKILNELVDRAAVLKSLKRTYEGTLDAGASKQALADLRAKFPSDEAWAAFLAKLELSEDEVEERLRRRLEAQSVLIARLSDMIHVARKDEDDWLAAHPGATREQATQTLAFEAANVAKPGVLADARRTAAARIVDPIIAPPEGPGVSEGVSRTPDDRDAEILGRGAADRALEDGRGDTPAPKAKPSPKDSH